MFNPNQYCQEQSFKSGSSFYYSFIFLTPPQRQAMNAVYAFCRAVDDIVDGCIEPDIARKKILWWHEELERVYASKAEHPIGQALSIALINFKLKKIIFEEILQGMLMDLQYQGYQTFADLKLYCHCVASTVGLLAVEILGYKQSRTIEYARTLGIALQLINIIRDVGEDVRRDRVYLAEIELKEFNYSLQELQSCQYNQNFISLMEFQAARARQYLQEAFALLPPEDRFSQRVGLIMAKIYETLLYEIEQSQFQVLHQRISLPPLRKLWLAYKTNYQEKKLYKHFKQTHQENFDKA